MTKKLAVGAAMSSALIERKRFAVTADLSAAVEYASEGKQYNCVMTFEYDPRKAASNLRKHGVSFKEATTAFSDPFTAEFPDDDHSEDEERWILIGLSAYHRILFVVYTERKGATRILGARLATEHERKNYEENKI